MAKRGTRYVYIEGEIWRLTDLQYLRYLAANVQRNEPVSQYGVLIGSGVNVTRFGTSEFNDEWRKFRAEYHGARKAK